MRKLSMDELNRPDIATFRNSGKIPVVVVLDNIRSFSNVGSIFRTADAFCIEAIHLCGITGCPPHREINKTALGATETVSWKYFETINQSLIYLKQQHYSIIAVEQTTNSIPLTEIQWPTSLALVFGNEVEGVSYEALNLSDTIIELPQNGTKHSLNVAVCAGIILWDSFKHFQYKIV
ncbi:MAG: RNA methyltransferase [Bacteroidales bacterium]|nr:RNA methyltransferase [Bacteroidales bacterium]